MKAKQRFGVAILTIAFAAVPLVQGQQAAPPSDSAGKQTESDPLAGLSPENRALFNALRNSAQQNDDASMLAAGKKLLPALTTGTPLYDFVTLLTAGSAVETGDTSYALNLLKPLTAAHPDDWRSASLLARAYAESGNKAQRDQQIAYVIALHKRSTDPTFAKLHVFPIQKVALHTGYALFLYPFEPLAPDNVYLLALIFTPDGKTDHRIELESEDGERLSSSRNTHGKGDSQSTRLASTARTERQANHRHSTDLLMECLTTTGCGT